MINRIIDFSANNRFFVFTVAAMACLAGWWSMMSVPLDAIPDLSDTQVIVYSRWDRSPYRRRPGDLSDSDGDAGRGPRSGAVYEVWKWHFETRKHELKGEAADGV